MTPNTFSAPTVGILGAPWDTGNMGVQALGVSLIRLLWEAAPHAEIVILMAGPKDRVVDVWDGERLRSVSLVCYSVSPFRSWRRNLFAILAGAVCYKVLPVGGVRRAIEKFFPWIGSVARTTHIGDIRGGDSFSDIYGARRFFVYCFLAQLSVLLVKGQLIQFPQTYGPFKNANIRRLAGFLLRASSLVIARDKKSQKVAQDLSGGRDVVLSPDVAFSLEAKPPEVVEVDSSPVGDYYPAPVGINVNGLVFNGGYTRQNDFRLSLDYPKFLADLIKELLPRIPGDIWLIPHTFAAPGAVESDPDASRKLKCALPAELQRRVRIVTGQYDQHQLKAIIGRCEFFVGSRMHSCIAALSQGVPCVGVAYSMKFGGVFETVGLDDWVVDGRSVDAKEAVARTIQRYGRREEVRESLQKRGYQARARLREISEMILTTSTSRLA